MTLAGLLTEPSGAHYVVDRFEMLRVLEVGNRVLLALRAENAHPILDRGDRGGVIAKRAKEAAKGRTG